MFQLNITKTDDEDLLGERTYYKNHLYFGKDSGDVLLPSLNNHQLTMEVVRHQGKTFVKGQVKKEFKKLLLNGKKVGSEFTCYEGDKFVMDQTEFTLVKLEVGPSENQAELIRSNLENMKEDRHPALEIVRMLEKKVEES